MRAVCCVSVLLLPRLAGAATLPPGFSETQIAGGLTKPTAMAFAPDGRLFICEQGGTLRVVKNGVLLAAPFVSLTVNSLGERGLLGIAFDPAFASNQYVYVYYTATSPNLHNRVSRFTASGDLAIAGSEVVILDLEPLSASNHNGGANTWGEITADNPFFSTAAGDNRAIWALGLRNPFTFAVQPLSGAMFINDVGVVTPSGLLWLDPARGFTPALARAHSGELSSFGPDNLIAISDVAALADGWYLWLVLVDEQIDGAPAGEISDFVLTVVS